MKAVYVKPDVEIEKYELNAAIATGCQEIVSLGPGDPETGVICKEYIQDMSLFSIPHYPPEYANFYEGSCSCYLSAGEGTLFTS